MSEPAALVTGGNKGIGYGIVRELCRQGFPGTVYLTARDENRGRAAVISLNEEGYANVKFIQLDVTDRSSIEKARDFIVKKHGGLDVLVNNAGIFLGELKRGEGPPTPTVDHSVEAVKKTMATNFTGLLNCCKILFPVLRPHARVVHVSSSLGSLRHLKNQELKNRLVSDNLTAEDLEHIASDYIKAAENGTVQADGYPDQFGPYAMSKILVSALAIVQQRQLDKEPGNDIIVNACCPGFVATDINQHMGVKTIEQGADTPTYLAMLPPQAEDPVHPRGQLVYERVVKDWKSDQ